MANIGKPLYLWIPIELYKKLKIKLIKEGRSLKEVMVTFLEYYVKEEKHERKQKNKTDRKANQKE